MFRMLGMLGRDRVEVNDSASLDTGQVVQDGVRGSPEIGAIATRNEHGVEVFVWNYHDDDVPVPPASIELTISGLPANIGHALLEHYRVDASHSNSFAAWQAMGSPQSPTPDEYKKLEAAGQLQLLTSPKWIEVDRGGVRLKFELPREGLSLLKIDW
jgi:xylan 1,4-beta-xylosidase